MTIAIRGASGVLATAIGTGGGAQTAYVCDYPLRTVTWTTTKSGTVSAVSVVLEGSVDGNTWFTLDTTTNIAGETRTIVDKPFTRIRANVGAITGGGNVSVAFAAV